MGITQFCFAVTMRTVHLEYRSFFNYYAPKSSISYFWQLIWLQLGLRLWLNSMDLLYLSFWPYCSQSWRRDLPRQQSYLLESWKKGKTSLEKADKQPHCSHVIKRWCGVSTLSDTSNLSKNQTQVKINTETNSKLVKSHTHYTYTYILYIISLISISWEKDYQAVIIMEPAS